jgi:hypothetical protein
MFDDCTRAGFALCGRFWPIAAIRHQNSSIAGNRNSLANLAVQADGSILLTDFTARTGGICLACLDVSGDAFALPMNNRNRMKSKWQ